MADFLLKFANFCCHGNKGGSNNNLDDSVWLAYPKTPSSVQKSGTYLKCKLSYGEFCVKKPYLVQESWWYLLYKLSNGRLSVEICQFLLLWATRVGLTKIMMTHFDWPTPRTPRSVQKSGTYLKCKLSYGEFCVKISKFLLPWQQG